MPEPVGLTTAQILEKVIFKIPFLGMAVELLKNEIKKIFKRKTNIYYNFEFRMKRNFSVKLWNREDNRVAALKVLKEACSLEFYNTNFPKRQNIFSNEM